MSGHEHILNTIKILAKGVEKPASLLQEFLTMLNSDEVSGLHGLAKRFNDCGLGEVINSWVSLDQNLSISAQEVHKILGFDLICQLAERSSMSTQRVSDSLAQLLPEMIDKLTPSGVLPSRDVLGHSIGILKIKLLG